METKIRYNRDPQTGKFTYSGSELAEKPIAVRLTQEIDNYVRSIPNKQKWLREIITRAVKEEQQNA